MVDALTGRQLEAGAHLELANQVRRITHVEGRLEVQAHTGTKRFEKVLFTAAPAELLRVAGASFPAAYRMRLDGLSSTAALCVVLELSRSLSPYYWLNIADPGFPFGGLIEHTNYIPRERYGGRHVLYISKYLSAGNPLWSACDDDVWSVYRPFLQRINPEFDDSWVLARHHFKAAYAQPVIPCNYPAVVPRFETPVPGLYHACMAQVYPEDRGQNYAVRSGNRAAAALLQTATSPVP